MRRLCLVAARSFAGAILILSLPFTADLLIGRLESFPALKDADLQALARGEPTAVVVLAAGRRAYAPEFSTSSGQESVDALTLERVRYAAHIAKQTKLPILVSGGVTNEPHSLADLMATVLKDDFDTETRWREAKSLNTAENAIFSARILKRAGIKRIFLVTHAWHMPRARTAFMANGLRVVPAPTAFEGIRKAPFPANVIPGAGPLRLSAYAIHEDIGAVWYALRYGY
jgi:uncharacterized SAM-binding protein YcdF (DUF218 family)